MKCEQCFHYAMCPQAQVIEKTHTCKHFKDKDLIVELPCKVGQEIFSFRWNVKSQKYEVHTGKAKNVRCDTVDMFVTVSDGERYCIWGKTVFLTREAAEAALKERIQNGKQ